jgi:hypothetical protein
VTHSTVPRCPNSLVGTLFDALCRELGLTDNGWDKKPRRDDDYRYGGGGGGGGRAGGGPSRGGGDGRCASSSAQSRAVLLKLHPCVN